MRIAIRVVSAFALGTALVGCGPTLRDRVDVCTTAPSPHCDYTLHQYASVDAAAARDAFRRMTTAMQRRCDALMTAATASESQQSRPLREVSDAAFVCLRLAALQLGAVGVDAGRIVSRESSLVPDAPPLNWNDGIAKLTFLCAAEETTQNDIRRMMRGTGASHEACMMLGDIARAQNDLGGAQRAYAMSCRRSDPASESRIAACTADAPTRYESHWFTDGVRAHMPPSAPAAPVADAAPSPAPVAAAAPTPTAGGSDEEGAQRGPLPVSLAPPSHPCLATWRAAMQNARVGHTSFELALSRNEGMPTICGGYRVESARRRPAAWALVHCVWQEHGMTAVAQSREMETLRMRVECRGNEVTLETLAHHEEGEVRVVRRFRRR